jgi:hypothetical protein
MCLSACVGAPVAEPGAAFADVPVTVDERAFVATFQSQTVGTVLTADGAIPVSGSGLRISGAGLGRDEGIIAKEAARMACTDQGGTFQPQAIGRYAAQEAWVFDGACA